MDRLPPKGMRYCTERDIQRKIDYCGLNNIDLNLAHSGFRISCLGLGLIETSNFVDCDLKANNCSKDSVFFYRIWTVEDMYLTSEVIACRIKGIE